MASSAASTWTSTAAAPSVSPAAAQAFAAARSLSRASRCSQEPQSAAVEDFLWRERDRSRRRPDDVERGRAWLVGHEAACAASEAVGCDCDWLRHAAGPWFQLAVAAQPCAALAGVGEAWLPHDQAQPHDAVV